MPGSSSASESQGLARRAGAVPVLPALDLELDAEEWRQELTCVVDLIGDLFLPVRQRADRGIRIDADLRGAGIAFLGLIRLQGGGTELGDICRLALLNLCSAASGDAYGGGSERA